MANHRTYLLKSELRGDYRGGKKVAEPQIGGKPIPLGEVPIPVEPITSRDMSAQEAILHIESTPAEELEGFLADDEDRSTVLAAWEEEFSSEEAETEETEESEESEETESEAEFEEVEESGEETETEETEEEV